MRQLAAQHDKLQSRRAARAEHCRRLISRAIIRRAVIAGGSMRNLGKYRVTDQEIIDCLTELRDDLVRNARDVGDPRPTLIDVAIERTVEHPRTANRIGVNKPFAHDARAPRPASSRRFVATPTRLRRWLTGERR